MKKFGFATVAASGLAAAVLGLAGPAQASVTNAPDSLSSIVVVPAGVDHNAWLNDIRPDVQVPQVDTSVQQSR